MDRRDTTGKNMVRKSMLSPIETWVEIVHSMHFFMSCTFSICGPHIWSDLASNNAKKLRVYVFQLNIIRYKTVNFKEEHSYSLYCD